MSSNLETAAPDVARSNGHHAAYNILESITDIVYTLDAEWRFVYANRAFYETTGRTAAETIGGKLLELFSEVLETPFYSALKKTLETRQPAEIEDSYPVLDKWFHVRVLPAENGGITVINTDITTRKFAETALRESEDKLRRTARFNEFSIKLADALRPLSDPAEIQATVGRVLGEWFNANRVLYFEMRGEDYFVERDYTNNVPSLAGSGYPITSFDEQMLATYRSGRVAWSPDVAADKHLSDEERAAFAAVQIGAYIGAPIVKDGEFVAGLSVQMRKPHSWTTEDIALVEEAAERTWEAITRARAEQALAKSEEQYRVLFNSIDEGFCTCEVIFDENNRPTDYRMLEVNPAFERLTGINAKEALSGKTILEVVPNLERHWIEIYGRVALTGAPVRFEQGSEALGSWFDVYAFRVGQAEERKVAILFTNITKRKGTETALRESEEFNRTMLESSPDCVKLLDLDGNLLYMNRNGMCVMEIDDFEPLRGRQWCDFWSADAQPKINNSLARAKRGESTHFQEFCPTAKGTPKWWDVIVSPVMDTDGQPASIVSVSRDITEPKRIEESLRESGRKLDTALQAGRMGSWTLDLISGELVASDTCKINYGRQPGDEFTYQDLAASIVAEDQEQWRETVDAAIAECRDFEIEYRVYWLDNSIHWVLVRGNCFPDETGKTVFLTGVSLDITERKLAEEKLRFLADLNHELLSLTEPDEIMATTARMLGEHLQVNRCAYAEVEADENHFNLTGDYFRDTFSLVGHYAFSDWGAEVLRLMRAGEPYIVDDAEIDSRTQESLETYRQTEIRAVICLPLHKNGVFTAAMAVHQKTPRAWKSEEIELVQLVVNRCWESLERARTDKQLRQTEERFRLLTENAEDYAIIFLDTEARITAWNVGAERILGYSEEEVIGQPGHLIFTPEDRENKVPEKELTTAMSKGNARDERWHLHKDGSRFYAFGEMIALYDDAQNLRGFAKLFRDLTERKKLDDALRESEALFRELAELLPASVFILKGDSHIYANAEAERMTGYTRQELLTVAPHQLTNEAGRKMIDEIRAARERGAETSAFHEMPLVTKSGAERYVLSCSMRTAQHGEPITLLASFDITEQKLAQEKLLESQTQLALALQAGKAGTYEWNIKDNINTWSPEIEKLYGVQVGTFEGDYDAWAKRVVPEDAAEVGKKIEAAITAQQDKLIYEFRVLLANGSHRWLEGRSRFEYDADGKPLRMFGINVDISESKQTQEALKELNRQIEQQSKVFDVTLSTITDYVYTFDRTGRFLFANQILLDLWGLTLDKAIGKTMAELDYPPEVETAILGAVEQVFETKETVKNETFYTSPSGESGYFENILSPVFDADGQVEVVIGSSRSITERKRAEEALREADRRKDEFLATLAHELRNPLAPIQTALEIMRNGASAEKTAEAREIAMRQIGQLKHLVDDLLDVSRITQNKIHLKKEIIDLRDALQSAIETSLPLINNYGHQLTINLPQTPVYISGDLVRLAQVFLNLLNNAAKFTEPGGRIDLTARAQDDCVVVQVKDTGAGIPPAMLESIFEMFSQVERTGERSQGGLGIGLNLVKRLVEKHGGNVTANSAGKNSGSEFIVRLPLTTSPEATAQIAPAETVQPPTSASVKRRILVVDDNLDAADMLQFALEIEKHTVRAAYNGAEALRVADEFQPDVCILDIGLPDIDGYTLARSLREKMPQVQLIALSGWGQAEDLRRSSAAGFNHHLVKPVKIDELNGLVSKSA